MNSKYELATRETLIGEIEKKDAERDVLQEHLKFLRSLVCDGAKEGFNPMVGDWADKLFLSNGKTSELIKGEG